MHYGFTEGAASSYQAAQNNHFLPTGGAGSTEGVGMGGDTFNHAGLETAMFDPVSLPSAHPGRPVPVGTTPTRPEPEPPQTSATETVPVHTRPYEPAATLESSKPAPFTTMEEELFHPTFPVAAQGLVAGRGQALTTEPTAPVHASVPQSHSATVFTTVPAQVLPTAPAHAQVLPTAASPLQGPIPQPTPAQTLSAGPAAPPQEIATEPAPAPVLLVRMGGAQSPRPAPQPTPAKIPAPAPAPLPQGLSTDPSLQQELPVATEAGAFSTERVFSGGIPPETAPSQGIPTESDSGGRGGAKGPPPELELNYLFAPAPPLLPEPAVEERPKESVQTTNGEHHRGKEG